jgi:O-antigen ligase
MMKRLGWHKYSAWLWPAGVSAVVLTAFAIRGSDLPAAATMLAAAFAILAAIAFILPASESPALAQRKAIRWLLAAFAVFIAALALSTAFAVYDPSAAWLEGIKLGGVICAFALGMRCSLADDRAKRLFEALLYAGGAWALASVIMFILDPAGIYGVVKFGAGRLTGAFSSPNSAGTLFGAISVMALGRVVSRVLTRRESQILERIDPVMTGVCAVSLAALMLTVSRGAIFSTVICLAVLSVLLLRNHLSLPKLAAVGVAVVVALAIIFATPLASVIGRLDGIDGDALVRATILKSHFSFAMNQPWFGSGLGSFNTMNSHIVTAQDYAELAVIRATHNVYLQWFEETGIVGLAGLVLLNLAILLPMISGARRRSQMGGRIWAVLAGYLVFLLHGFTDYAFQEPALAMFVALLLGCGFAMATNTTAARGGGGG